MKLFGKDINLKSSLVYVLKRIYGVGSKVSLTLCKKLNINPALRWTDLSASQQFEIIQSIEKDTFDLLKGGKVGYLTKIKQLRKTGTLRAFRHMKGLPVNGQRTRSNAQTSRRLNKKNILVSNSISNFK